MGTDSTKKATRLARLQRVFFRNREGYRTAELARLFDVEPRTISRDIEDLQAAPFYLPLVQEPAPDWRWRLIEQPQFTLPPLNLTLQEGAALYLAARLLSRASDENNPFVDRALIALSNVLPPEVGDQIQRFVSARAKLVRENTTFVKVFEVVTLGWATGRVVHIWHRSGSSNNVHDYLFHPYLIEASAVGYATYAIGWTSWFEKVRTFKLERVVHAELMDDTFVIPDDFDGVELLKTAWNISFAGPDEKLVKVKLKFSSERIVRRVKESQWHPSQKIYDSPGGGCVLEVSIGQVWEIKPFVRGWGPDCEVLEPKSLRDQIAKEMQDAAELYMKTE